MVVVTNIMKNTKRLGNARHSGYLRIILVFGFIFVHTVQCSMLRIYVLRANRQHCSLLRIFVYRVSKIDYICVFILEFICVNYIYLYCVQIEHRGEEDEAERS